MSRKLKLASLLAALAAAPGASAADAPATGSPAADRQAPAHLPGAGQGRQAPARLHHSVGHRHRQAANAEQINYGKRLLNETRRLLPNNTGASMNCNSCHVQQGKPMGAPYINTVNSFRNSIRAPTAW